MPKFPVDAPRDKVLAAFALLGFYPTRASNHIVMMRDNDDGTRTPLVVLNHRRIKGSTLRMLLTQVGVGRDEFLRAYNQV